MLARLPSLTLVRLLVDVMDNQTEMRRSTTDLLIMRTELERGYREPSPRELYSPEATETLFGRKTFMAALYDEAAQRARRLPLCRHHKSA